MERNSLVEKMYEYLKDKYGIQETETCDGEKVGIPIKIEILIPGVAKNSEKHKWVAFLEKQNSDKINALIIGQNCKDDNCYWSRYIEVKNHEDHASFGWFKIKDNIFMRPKYDFKSLIIFMEVLQDFSETI